MSSRPLGGAWLLDALWRRLGVDGALAARCSARAGSRPMSSGCCSRWSPTGRCDPFSKLAAAEWASTMCTIPGLEAMDEDQAYRAMDLLVGGRHRGGGAGGGVLRRAPTCSNLEVDLLFFDTTSHLLRARRARPGSDDGEPGVPRARALEGPPARPAAGRDRARGHPRGDPGAGAGCGPGNTNDQTVLEQVKDDLAGWRLGRLI